GKTCAECHRDKHAGRYGLVCNSCHNTSSFKDVSRALHDSGATRLQGTHDRVPCWRCHDDDTQLAGIGDLCQMCHWEDDVHRNGLGSMCGECHGQVDWMPARFNHAQVGFLLRGSHRLAPCDGCHGLGTFQGTPQNCEFCHTVDAVRVTDPLHTAEFSDCRTCHNEVAFVPVRRYHPTYALRGLHSTVACSDCHSGGTYAGTPTECFGCHESQFFDPASSPNHAAAGFSTRCEDCHSSISWRPARYQHQRFIRRGVHRVTACDRCHPGEDYAGAFGGTVTLWDCFLCHDTGAPADPGGGWGQDHNQKGYPNTCDLCHLETAWKPAKTPP
ncbi:MAG: cytochrome c3 family protein, partial [Myxococcota bacterium]